jgi:hypothetical protein
MLPQLFVAMRLSIGRMRLMLFDRAKWVLFGDVISGKGPSPAALAIHKIRPMRRTVLHGRIAMTN